MSEVLIQTATADDISQITLVRMNAFDGSLLSDFWEPRPHSVSREARADRVDIALKKEFFSEPKEGSPQIFCQKAVVDGKIVGFSIWAHEQKDWKVYADKAKAEKDAHVKTEEELKEQALDDAGMDVEFGNMFWASIGSHKADLWQGKEFLYLRWLAISPGQQGKGIGKKLLQWGFDESKKTGLPCYLEASEAGRPVYAKSGFETIKELPFTSDKVTGKTYTITLMKRA